eukprot:scaffold490_cov148-Skeletonema_menzelii.AAC.6
MSVRKTRYRREYDVNYEGRLEDARGPGNLPPIFCIGSTYLITPKAPIMTPPKQIPARHDFGKQKMKDEAEDEE